MDIHEQSSQLHTQPKLALKGAMLYNLSYQGNWELGPISRKPWRLFWHVKPQQNFEPYDYRAVFHIVLI